MFRQVPKSIGLKKFKFDIFRTTNPSQEYCNYVIITTRTLGHVSQINTQDYFALFRRIHLFFLVFQTSLYFPDDALIVLNIYIDVL